MMSSSANAHSARVAQKGAPHDPWLADTLPPDVADELTFSKVDIDIDLGLEPEPVGHVDLDLELDDRVSTDPMHDFGTALAAADATVQTDKAVVGGDALTPPQPQVRAAPPIVAKRPPAPSDGWRDTERRLPPSWADKRVMVVSADESERMYLRARLSLVRLVWADEAATTTQALAALATRPYAMAFVNVDSVAVDVQAIAAQLRAGNVAATLILTSNAVSGAHPLDPFALWRRWRLSRLVGHDRNAEVLAKPLEPAEVIGLLSRLTTPLVV